MTQTYKIQVSMNQAHLVESSFVWKQGDFGFNVEIEVLDFDATGSTPQIIFRKSNGAVEATTITVSGNKYTYTLRGTELDTPGPGICDLKLKNSTTQRISTASFKFFVIPDTEDGLNQQASSYSDTIAQIVDGFEEEVDAVRKTFEHTTKLISSGKNLFNKDDVEEGYYVNYADGQKYENANYCIFYSPIGENVKLTTGRVVQLAFFDEDGQYISGDYNSSNVSKTFTTPADTAYMWVSVKIADLNIFQIEIGETVTAYEPYYNQFTYKPAGSDIVVALDGSGDYTKITDALNYCLTHPDTTVYVKEGTYDFITELGNTYFANFDYVAYTNMGPKIGNGTKLIMSSGAKITCHYTGDNADVLTGFSPLNAYLDNKGFTLDNVTIECSRVRYCVHDDVGSELSMYKNVYQNCHFVINNTSNAEYQSHCTLGGGLGVHGEIEIKNCIFESLMGDGIYSYAVAYHNSAANTGNEKSRIVFEGNVVKGIDTVQFTDHGTSTLLTPCLASNNNLGAAVRHTKTNVGVPDNMEVLDWNNYVRPQQLEEVSGNPISFSDSAIDHSAINPVITLEPIQAGSGTPSPENIRPISGYDKIEVLSCGAKVWNGLISNGHLDGNGNYVADTLHGLSDYIMIAPGSYSIKTTTYTSFSYWFVNAFDSNKNFIGTISENTHTSGTAINSTVTVSDNARYIRIQLNGTGQISANTDSKMYLGLSTATQDNNYHKTADLSESLGQTVYGGSLNLRTGVLTVDRGRYKVDPNDILFDSTYLTVITGATPLKQVESGELSKYISSHMKSHINSGVASMNNEFTIDNNNKVKMRMPDTITTSSSATSYFTNNDVYICGLLATPVEIQLTPHELKLAKGYNYISTNGTLIELTYIQTASE